MTVIAGHKQREYARHQPILWRASSNSDDAQKLYFERQIARQKNIVWVCERHEDYRFPGVLIGFIIAKLHPAPPVYDPGGLTCNIDDFIVADPKEWLVTGRGLLDITQREAKARGAVQTVVVCGHLDQPKRRMLAALNFSIASEWHVKTIE